LTECSLVGGSISSLADYHASAVRNLWIYIIPEFVRFFLDEFCYLLWKSQEKIKITARENEFKYY
jgi:hypothetical protein